MVNGAKGWCVTVNNPSEGAELLCDWTDCEYAIWQLETGKEGTLHYQGYVEMKLRRSLSFMKRLSPRAHWETRRGSRDQARDYCRKEDSRLEGPWEKGEWNEHGQGKRSDLEDACEFVQTNTMKQLAEQFPTTFVRYQKGLEKYHNFFVKPRNFKTEVIVLWGPSNVGKSYLCRQASPNAYSLPAPKDKSDVWWDGYDGLADVIINEFYGWIRWASLLQLLDEDPTQVPYKGGMIPFAGKRIYITSNKHPQEWYPGIEDKTPLLRRIEWLGSVHAIGCPPKWEKDKDLPQKKAPVIDPNKVVWCYSEDDSQ